MDLDTVFEEVVARGLVNDEQPSLDLINVDYLKDRMASLLEAFPEPFFNHAMAVKANSIRGVMTVAKDQGLGAECASLQEAKHALSLGFAPDLVVFDSPVKTPKDIREAIELGLHMNLDNDLEITRVNEIIASRPVGQAMPAIGLRINPVVGAGHIAMISTATKLSKFGLPLMESSKDVLIGLFKENPWLTGVHIHVGSQGVPLEKFVDGCKVLMDFVAEIESVCPGQIKVIDIGGGLSTTYVEKEEPKEFTYKEYRRRLEEVVPGLLTGRYKVVTEMGRSLFLKAGTSISRVEYVKNWVDGQNPIVLTHLGTNQFPRCAYLPHIWRHRFSLYNSAGQPKEGDIVLCDLAGPLCFQGDYLAKEVELPSPNASDLLAIHDTGAYTMAMYCKFNSIRASPIYGYWKGEDGKLWLVCYKKRETVEECLDFWGLLEPEIIL